MLEYLNVEFLLPVAVWTIPFGLVLVMNEYLDRKTDWHREIHRKLGHVVSGATIVCSTWFLSYEQLILFALILIAGAIATYIIQFESVHGVTRKTIGTFLFPVAFLILTVLFFNDNTDLVRYGILLLTIPDAAAAVIGSQWGRQIPRFNKSFLGSTVFFVGTVLVTAYFVPVWWVVLLVAVVLTVVEFFSQWGIDNLLLPLIGSGLLFLFV